MAHLFVKAVLALIGLFYFGFGVWLLIEPKALLDALAFTSSTPDALIEIRAFYGGFELAFGLFLFMSAWKPAWHVPTLSLLSCVLAGVTMGRFIGLYTVGSNEQMMLYTVIEAAMTLLAVMALLIARKQD